MYKSSLFSFLLILCTVQCATKKSTVSSLENSNERWVNMLDPNLNKWEKFMGVPHSTVEGIGDHPTSEDVHVGTPMGVDNDPKNVFTMIKENGEDVLHVTGEIYGGLTTRASYENYHVTMQYKWGTQKWEPRLADKRDAGLLYHCTGQHGAFWNVWMRCLEFQIQETDTGDFIALAGANAMTQSQPSEDNKGYKYDPSADWFGVGEAYGNWECKKVGDFEKPNGEYNTIDLYVLGDQSIHLVNGHVVNVSKDAHLVVNDVRSPLTKGKLQLQSEAAEIYYKGLKMKKISSFPEALDFNLFGK